MKDAVDAIDEEAFGTKKFVANFYNALESEQKEQFRTIEKQIREDFGNISRLQRGMMAISFMIQMEAMAAGLKAIENEDELPKWKRDLLDFARKLYKSEVSNVAQKQKVEGERKPMSTLLKEWEMTPRGGDVDDIETPDFEKHSLDELDIGGGAGGDGGYGSEDDDFFQDGGAAAGDGSDGSDGSDDSGDDGSVDAGGGDGGGREKHSASSFINVG